MLHVDGLVQDCSNSSALALELLQSCTKPSNIHYNPVLIGSGNGSVAIGQEAIVWTKEDKRRGLKYRGKEESKIVCCWKTHLLEVVHVEEVSPSVTTEVLWMDLSFV